MLSVSIRDVCFVLLEKSMCSSVRTLYMYRNYVYEDDDGQYNGGIRLEIILI